jgi:hypothetical protein
LKGNGNGNGDGNCKGKGKGKGKGSICKASRIAPGSRPALGALNPPAAARA